MGETKRKKWINFHRFLLILLIINWLWKSKGWVTDWNLSSRELESGNALRAFLQTSAPVLDKISGPMGVRFFSSTLSGPLNRLNAILSLLHPLDRYRTPLCDSECDWEALSRPISHPPTGRISQPPHSKHLRKLNGAIVVLQCLNPLKNKGETRTR